MAVELVVWTPGAGLDIHLIPGLSSPPLTPFVLIRDTTNHGFTGDAPPDGVTVTASTNINPQLTTGVRVDADDGRVLLDPSVTIPAGTPPLRSFILTITVDDGTTSKVVRVRVQLHQSLTRVWLTPSPLTVRAGTKTSRHTVLARFDDGVIGDISNWAAPIKAGAGKPTNFFFALPAQASGDVEPILEFSSDSDDIDVDDELGRLTCTDPTAAPATITVKLAGLSAIQGTGQARGGPAWNSAVNATLLKGPGLNPNDPTIHNVLFLSDGFSQAELAQYESLVREVAGKFVERNALPPFDILADNRRLNYFSASVPSPEAGHSVLAEVVLTNIVDADFDGAYVPMPDFTPATHVLDLQRLIGLVGLPVPHDPAAMGLQQMTAVWEQLYTSAPSLSSLTQPVFDSWVALRQRALLDEVDTAFQVASGERPRVDRPLDPLTQRLHPLRGSDAFDNDDSDNSNLDELLDALLDAQTGQAVKAWTRPPVAAPTSGSRLVMFICRSDTLGGGNSRRGDQGSARYCAITLGDAETVAGHPSTTGGPFAPAVSQIPPSATIYHWTAAARELARSFHLGPERGGRFETFDENHFRDSIDAFINVQASSELINPGRGGLVADNIRWNKIPRIVKAGVLAADPTDTGGSGTGPFTLTFVTGHGAAFAVGDVVKLRDRELTPDTSYSQELRITAKPSADTATAEGLFGGVSLAMGDGDLVILPQRAAPTAGQSVGSDITLVSPAAINRINATNNPLNIDANANAAVPCDDLNPATLPTYALNFTSANHVPRLSFTVLGLYDNGFGCNCGVFRPSGGCIMAKPYETYGGTVPAFAFEFCLVCQYAIIDGIDPRLHPKLDPAFTRATPT